MYFSPCFCVSHLSICLFCSIFRQRGLSEKPSEYIHEYFSMCFLYTFNIISRAQSKEAIRGSETTVWCQLPNGCCSQEEGAGPLSWQPEGLQQSQKRTYSFPVQRQRVVRVTRVWVRKGGKAQGSSSTVSLKRYKGSARIYSLIHSEWICSEPEVVLVLRIQSWREHGHWYKEVIVKRGASALTRNHDSHKRYGRSRVYQEGTFGKDFLRETSL